MRKKTKMANICRSLRTKFFFSPVLKSPTHVEFTDVKKNGSKISHLGTFKSREMTGRTQTRRGGWGRRGKDERKQNTLAPLVGHIPAISIYSAQSIKSKVGTDRSE